MKTILLSMQYLPHVLAAVKSIEEVVGAGNGKTKKQIIMEAIQAGAKVGGNVPNEHVVLISNLIDMVVTMLNASGIFKTKTVAPVPVT